MTINRRSLVLGTAAVAALAALPASAASQFVDYKPGVIENALSSGKTVFVDYSAWWCTTCMAQKRVIARLVEQNPDYAKSMLFVRVDWDEFGDQPVARDRNIPRRSTLLVLRGNKELGRVVAGTSEADIKALLDKGV
ncbi:MAG: thioredoxin family protein [Hyphomicrobiales bacterium]|nr:thioredoxin family protein [Hyphomicrobiales bacterium]